MHHWPYEQHSGGLHPWGLPPGGSASGGSWATYKPHIKFFPSGIILDPMYEKLIPPTSPTAILFLFFRKLSFFKIKFTKFYIVFTLPN